MRRAVHRLLAVLLLLALAAAAVWAFRPRPVAVDGVPIDRGPITVTVAAEGRTAVREPYVVSLPLAGRLQRLALHTGDPVVAGTTVLAVIDPTQPELLDERARAVAEARVRATAAAEAAARSAVERAQVNVAFAAEEVERRAPLARAGGLPASELTERMQRLELARADLRSSELAVRVAVFEREQAEAALLYARPRGEGVAPPPRHEVRSPISGTVLRVFAPDEGVLPGGARLLELGDLTDLEVEADVLTREAVRVEPGQRVLLDEWGGERVLDGRVRRVEPAAFTKPSALGVEEQRVWVRIDLVSPPTERARLGQGFRVGVRIVVDEVADALRAPLGALFRDGEAWAVFRFAGGRAELARVRTGRSDGRFVEVLEGLVAGDVVVAYPSDRVAAGVALTLRGR